MRKTAQRIASRRPAKGRWRGQKAREKGKRKMRQAVSVFPQCIPKAKGRKHFKKTVARRFKSS